MSQNKQQTQTTKSFFQRHILPVLFVFLIPGFSAWFFSYAEGNLDGEAFQQVKLELDKDPNISPKEKSGTLEFYRKLPISRIMASDRPELRAIQKAFGPAKFR